MTVIVAAAVLVVSVTDVAVSVTVAGVGTLAGAVYVMAVPEALEFAESLPQVAPMQPGPASVQVTPLPCKSFVTVAINACVPLPACTLAAEGATVTPMVAVGVVMVIVAADVRTGSVTEVAVSVTFAGEGALEGAVYVMDEPLLLEVAERVPHAAPVQPAPERTQVTPLFCESLETLALKLAVCPACTEAVAGVTATEIGAVIVTVAEELLLASATAVAVTVTVAGAGMLAGAVYVMLPPEVLDAAESAPQVAPLHPVPESDHVTPSPCTLFCTIAVKTCVPTPAWRFALLGESETLIAGAGGALPALLNPAQPDAASDKSARPAAASVPFLCNLPPLEDIDTLPPDWKSARTLVAFGHPGDSERGHGYRNLCKICIDSVAERFSRRYRSKVKILNCTNGQEPSEQTALCISAAVTPFNQMQHAFLKRFLRGLKRNLTTSAATAFEEISLPDP